MLTPIYEPQFSQYSYGFRRNKSAHQALEQARQYIEDGYNFVVDIDLKGFSDINLEQDSFYISSRKYAFGSKEPLNTEIA
ncbi:MULTISPECIES: hypothetical protein [unclassified Bacillus (in: firmicutes)]|uniref:hypothetical protein n=1 Tax=unclassified Bacillus (in: firmicutes) TaxID=185979 RepID=UPI002036085A|nr:MULTISPECIES: hypothetical protein [unclassified Bacillus (in: firmicutes)]